MGHESRGGRTVRRSAEAMNHYNVGEGVSPKSWKKIREMQVRRMS
jgi:hypothetical protein